MSDFNITLQMWKIILNIIFVIYIYTLTFSQAHFVFAIFFNSNKIHFLGNIFFFFDYARNSSDTFRF